MEATLRRMARWIDTADVRHFIAEHELLEQRQRVDTDLQIYFDHVLRTPLSSISGYAQLLAEETLSANDMRQFAQIIAEQSQIAIAALEKVSFGAGVGGKLAPALEQINLNTIIGNFAEEIAAADDRPRNDIKLHWSATEELLIEGAPDLIRQAMWEVVHNAMIHTDTDRVTVELTIDNEMAVVEIADDGPGIPIGSEDLIFMRFFQAPSVNAERRGQRGLGLGLYMARRIAEQHGGELRFVRKNKGAGLFRFAWPLSTQKSQSKDKKSA